MNILNACDVEKNRNLNSGRNGHPLNRRHVSLLIFCALVPAKRWHKCQTSSSAQVEDFAQSREKDPVRLHPLGSTAFFTMKINEVP